MNCFTTTRIQLYFWELYEIYLIDWFLLVRRKLSIIVYCKHLKSETDSTGKAALWVYDSDYFCGRCSFTPMSTATLDLRLVDNISHFVNVIHAILDGSLCQ